MADLYKVLEEELRLSRAPSKPERGNLGYKFGGSYKITNPTRKSEYFVRITNVGVLSVPHHNRVSPVPDLPVLIQTDANGGRYISSVDYTAIEEVGNGYTPSYEMQLHGHERLSGMEYPVDLRLIDNLKVKYVPGSLITYISGGRYDYNGKLYWWSSQDGYDLFSHVPGSNLQRWVILGINPTVEPHAMVGVGSDTYPAADDLSTSVLTDVAFEELGYIAIAAVKLKSGQTSVREEHFYSLGSIVGARGYAGASDEGGDSQVTGVGGIHRFEVTGDLTIASGEQGIYLGRLSVDGDFSIEEGAELHVL